MKPNILFIVVDCLRSDVIFDEDTHTPNIDSLREGAVNFSNTISSSTSTGPCFGSLLTGLYPFNHGLRVMSRSKMRDSVETAAELLKKEGYNTYGRVSGPLSPVQGFSRGFDEYEQREVWENLHSPWYDVFLKDLDNGHFKEPWFIFLHIWDLHQPRITSREYDRSRYGKNLYERSLASIDDRLQRSFKRNEEGITILTGDHGEKMSDSFLEEMMDRFKCYYYPHVRWKHKRFHKRASKFFRGALNSIKRSDSEFGATHGYQLYRSLITTPLIVKGLDVPSRMEEGLIRHIDIVPSILDAVTDRKGDFDGIPTFSPNDNMPQEAYSEVFLGDELDEERWMVSLVTNDHQYISKPRDDYEKLFGSEASVEKERRIKERMKQKIEKINPEIIYGCRFDSQLEGEREMVEERLRTLGYLD